MMCPATANLCLASTIPRKPNKNLNTIAPYEQFQDFLHFCLTAERDYLTNLVVSSIKVII